ncbi:hypothetical protein ACLKA7_006369 [Drosophila subpalustris]
MQLEGGCVINVERRDVAATVSGGQQTRHLLAAGVAPEQQQQQQQQHRRMTNDKTCKRVRSLAMAQTLTV